MSVHQIAIFNSFKLAMFIHVASAGTIRRLMLDLSTMMKRNLGVKGLMLHFLVLPKMKSIKLMQLIWSIQVAVY
jgi:hypothetical protein